MSEPMRCYVMYTTRERYLCFGPDAVSAAEHLRAFGVDPDRVSVSQGFPIPMDGLAVSMGGCTPYLKLADGRGAQGREVPGDVA